MGRRDRHSGPWDGVTAALSGVGANAASNWSHLAQQAGRCVGGLLSGAAAQQQRAMPSLLSASGGARAARRSAPGRMLVAHRGLQQHPPQQQQHQQPALGAWAHALAVSVCLSACLAVWRRRVLIRSLMCMRGS